MHINNYYYSTIAYILQKISNWNLNSLIFLKSYIYLFFIFFLSFTHLFWFILIRLPYSCLHFLYSCIIWFISYFAKSTACRMLPHIHEDCYSYTHVFHYALLNRHWCVSRKLSRNTNNSPGPMLGVWAPAWAWLRRFLSKVSVKFVSFKFVSSS